ncbi:unnamed protein product [Blepharisma stoltei]|uniref:Uncharacterized protein n=1 Tax=Blepharisma stoltei TaxID=1481888 RepID=A0AAU9J0L0_9CILI|nr:unnamed protein product [Blepharisma stoltei]
MNSNLPIQIKVVILGDSGVGKSSIILRFVYDDFKGETDSTIGAAYKGKVYQHNNCNIQFNIWDTAGQEKFKSLAKMYYRDATAAILVYDITNSQTYDGLKEWYRELKEFGPEDIILCIAGNKEDLVDSESVQLDTVEEFAESIGAYYKRTSAKTNYGIDMIFKEIANKVCADKRTTQQTILGSMTLLQENIPQKKKGCC